MSAPTLRAIERRVDQTLRWQIEAMDAAYEPLCRQCHASFRADLDTCCAECRHDTNELYAILAERDA